MLHENEDIFFFKASTLELPKTRVVDVIYMRKPTASRFNDQIFLNEV